VGRDPLPRVTRFRRGYHRRQVDAFLNHIELSLTGVLPTPSAAEVRQAGFELARGGYRTTAVDAALDALEERVLLAARSTGGRRGRVDTQAETEFLRGELTMPYMKRFPRARALQRGYDVDDVDDFVDRVVAVLDGQRTLTVEEVRTAPFRPRRGGYLEDVVDETLDRVVELLLLARQQGGRENVGR